MMDDMERTFISQCVRQEVVRLIEAKIDEKIEMLVTQKFDVALSDKLKEIVGQRLFQKLAELLQPKP